LILEISIFLFDFYLPKLILGEAIAIVLHHVGVNKSVAGLLLVNVLLDLITSIK